MMIVPLVAVLVAQAPTEAELRKYLREHARLTPAEMAQVEAGQAVAKVLPSPTPDHLYVFGAVRIQGSPDSYLRFARDVNRLRQLPGYLGAREFSTPATLKDLDGFALTADDIKSLDKCRPGNCEVQLPVEAIEGFKRDGEVNQRTRELALAALQRYQASGDKALGAYHDRKEAEGIADEFASLLGNMGAVGEYLPDLMSALKWFPHVTPLPRSDSFFYWERVDFGMKPTLRLNHGIVFRETGWRGVAEGVAIKQIYASHYFRAALDLTTCVRDGNGFYLINLRGSKQAGLTGMTGGMLRSIIVKKTRSAQEKALAGIKKALEAGR